MGRLFIEVLQEATSDLICCSKCSTVVSERNELFKGGGPQYSQASFLLNKTVNLRQSNVFSTCKSYKSAVTCLMPVEMFQLFIILLALSTWQNVVAPEVPLMAEKRQASSANSTAVNKTKVEVLDTFKKHGTSVVDILHDEIFGKDGNKSIELLNSASGHSVGGSVEKGEIPYQVGLGLRDGEKFILCCGGSNFQVGDVSLVLLDGMVDFNEYAQPINLPLREMTEPVPGNAIVSGWGQTTPGGSLAKFLRKAELPVVETKKCKQLYSATFHPLVDAHLCAGFLDGGGVDACHGDSGGPLVCKESAQFTVKVRLDDGWVKEEHERPYLCGVVNFGKFCADPKYPGVYAKVSHYIGWIQDTMRYATENLKNEQIEIDKLQVNKNSSIVQEEDGSAIPNIKYTFVGMVHNGNTLPRGSTDKPCLAVLLSSNLAITASGCVPQTPEEKWKDSSVKIVFGDQKAGSRTTQQAMDILYQFAFKPETFLDQLNAPIETKRVASRAITPPGDAVVLQFTNSVSFSDAAYPVNFPRSTNFIGLWAEVVGKSTLDSDRVAMARAEIVPLAKCGYDTTMGMSDDVICAKIVNGLPCTEFNLGSGLICRGKNGGNFLCGIVTRKPGENPIINRHPSNLIQRSHGIAGSSNNNYAPSKDFSPNQKYHVKPKNASEVNGAAASDNEDEMSREANNMTESERMTPRKHKIKPRNPDSFCLFKKFWIPGSHPSLKDWHVMTYFRALLFTHIISAIFTVGLGGRGDRIRVPSFGRKDVAVFSVPGEEAKKGDVPYQVEIGLERKNGSMKHVCAAALISRTWVLGAAHCFDPPWNVEENVGKLTAVAGEWDLAEPHPEEQRLRILAVVLHQSYSRTTRQNDIALVLLDNVVKFNEFVWPVNLPSSANVNPSAGGAISSGWGSAAKNGSRTRYLKNARVPIVPTAVCQSPVVKITENQICGGYMRIGRADACEDDAGGPLVCEEPLVRFVSGGNSSKKLLCQYLCGIESEAGACGEANAPGIYTKVSNYLNWMKKTLKSFIRSEENPIFYPFLAIPSLVGHGVSEPPVTVSCAGVILSDTLVLTLRECMEKFAQGTQHLKVSYKVEARSSLRWHAVDVVDWFDFHPSSFLHSPVKYNYLVRGEAHMARKRSVVLRLSQPIMFSSEAYPVNYPETKNFTGMFATMVAVKGTLDNGKIMTGVLEIMEISKCSMFDLPAWGLDRNEVLCAKHMYGTQLLNFPPGSPVMCDLSRSRLQANRDYPMSFLCGISVISKETDLPDDVDQNTTSLWANSSYAVFKKFYVQGMTDEGSQLSLVTLAKIGNPFLG
ncbi:unnamed protein product [Notodromas monacha]|uniref:Peptidase S1 domain-containing protein n=1 Tax=Notodromas monacha TaxID=399045 RepID=A0A7R9G8K4_9CRUS|nr:unnamed protein product [Notodromas monacha]CAG0913275.1 unnamed protein product [Notodromas monacha]